MLSEGATSALDASKAGRCFGWDVRIRFGRKRQRDGRGESDGKYAAKRNNRHQMPGKVTKKRENR